MSRVSVIYFLVTELLIVGLFSPMAMAFDSCESSLSITANLIHVVDPEDFQGLSASMYGIMAARTQRERNEAVGDAVGFANRLFDYLCNLNFYIENGNESSAAVSEMRKQLVATREYLARMVGLKTIDMKLAISNRTRAIRNEFGPTQPIGFVPTPRGNKSQRPQTVTTIGGSPQSGMRESRPAPHSPEVVSQSPRTFGFSGERLEQPYGRVEVVRPLGEFASESKPVLPIGLDHNLDWVRMNSQSSQVASEKVPMGFARQTEPFVDDDFVLIMYLDPRKGVFSSTKIPIQQGR